MDVDVLLSGIGSVSTTASLTLSVSSDVRTLFVNAAFLSKNDDIYLVLVVAASILRFFSALLLAPDSYTRLRFEDILK